MDRKKVAKNYFQTWFFADLLSSFPFSYLYFAESGIGVGGVAQSSKLLRIVRITKYARLLRMVRFLKVNKLLQHIEEIAVSEIINLCIKIMKILVLTFIITHWIACIFYLTATISYE